MTSDKEYVAYAREFVRLANTLDDDKQFRERLLKSACHLMETAAQERLARAVDPVAKGKLQARR
jgi:hypothetical protein